MCATSPSLTARCLAVCLCVRVCTRLQFLCPGCQRHKQQGTRRNKSCWPCDKYMQLHGHWPCDAPATDLPPVPASPPPPLFDHDPHSHSHLSHDQRVAITVLHKEGRDDSYIAQRIPCGVRSVRYWLEQEDIQDSPRRGRKRTTTAAVAT
jgi:hypothetical protein